MRKMNIAPSYMALYESGELDNKIEQLYKRLESCDLCPRECHVNRFKSEKGFCKAGEKLRIHSYFPHFGEERALVGIYGSGTIFLSHCSLHCVYCQNYDISILNKGREITIERAAEMILELQATGCHNINLVTPTHYAPQLVKAIKVAIEHGLRLPVVWNCGGYEKQDVILLLDKIVDIYMPDIKYHSQRTSQRYSSAPDYFERCSKALIEMHRQVGDLKLHDGIAYRGLLIRHLVLPSGVEDSKKIVDFIASVSKQSYVNIMSQYRPAHRACKYAEINRRVSDEEVDIVRKYAHKMGLFSSP
ncbi:MAG: radical SAM protein [Candidatus Methanofastidiosia archaeon]